MTGISSLLYHKLQELF